ncbi:GDSL-type esterase/lipase family protein [Granulicella aggregans]|uniref:GDSL-type esterase/lipase family protein n=1 Tax=Granulicella aggregans TaxID=474949 RepID=UPI001C859BEB
MHRTDELPASFNDETVFLGDSITCFWSLPEHNAGIPGQTTSQIEARFQTAVVQSGLPKVVILTGANDVRVANPDYSGVLANIQKMVAQGKQAGIDVILCELTPITCCDTQVRTLNAMIKDYAKSRNLLLVDYYTPMAGKDSTYLGDGLHPNALGYSIMEDTLTKSLKPVS